MQETPEDIAALQGLLDRSYTTAGAHLTSIHTASARTDAEELVTWLDRMQVFVVEP